MIFPGITILKFPDIWKWKWADVWPSMVTRTRNLTHPSAHTPWTHTHPEQWAPGEQLGVRCLAQGSHLSRGIEGGRERWTFTPPTYNPWDSKPQPLGYKSDSLTIRPRLPLPHFWGFQNHVQLYKLEKNMNPIVLQIFAWHNMETNKQLFKYKIHKYNVLKGEA